MNNSNQEENNTTSSIEELGQRGLYINLDGYEGPLDLLLNLAKSQKVDLRKLEIGLLADQYLGYLKTAIDKVKIDFLADYLVVASWLTFLKSKLILPEEEGTENNIDEMNQLLALRLRRLETVRKYEVLLFDRPKLGEKFFSSGNNREIEIVREDFFEVDLIELLKSYLQIGHKKNLEFSFYNKENYLFLDRAINFIEKKLKGSKDWLLIYDLASEIHSSSGAQPKSCLASIFCGSLEFVRTGKIEIKQNSLFGDIKLLETNKMVNFL